MSDCEDVVSGSFEVDDSCDVAAMDSVDSYVLVKGDDDIASLSVLDSAIEGVNDVVIVDSRNKQDLEMSHNS